MKAESLRAYWCDPDDGLNSPQSYLENPDTHKRSKALVSFVKHNFPDRQITILELGSGTGRNLRYLLEAGYHSLLGIELSPNYIEAMREHYPRLSDRVLQGPIEDILPRLPNRYDLVFSMAVLEHIPPESEGVFRHIARVSKELLTIEDEIRSNPRQFPRNYRNVFCALGMEYLGGWRKIPGLSDNFAMRRLRSSNYR